MNTPTGRRTAGIPAGDRRWHRTDELHRRCRRRLHEEPGNHGHTHLAAQPQPAHGRQGQLGHGHISGNTKGQFIPTDPLSQTPEGGSRTAVNFSRNLWTAGAQFEFNFLGYGMGAAYKGLSRWTPYLLAGAGMTIGFGGGGKIRRRIEYPRRRRLPLQGEAAPEHRASSGPSASPPPTSSTTRDAPSSKTPTASRAACSRTRTVTLL